jgi:hypothetical protein
MERLLKRAGFISIVRASGGVGVSCKEIVLDDRKYEWESLYVEAVK